MSQEEFKGFFTSEICTNTEAYIGALDLALEQLRIMDLQLHHPEHVGKRTYPSESEYGIPHYSQTLTRIPAEHREFEISRVKWNKDSFIVADEDGVTSLIVGVTIGKWMWDKNSQVDPLSAVLRAECRHTTSSLDSLVYQILAGLTLDQGSREIVVHREAEIHKGPKHTHSTLGPGRGGRVTSGGGSGDRLQYAGDHQADED